MLNVFMTIKKKFKSSPKHYLEMGSGAVLLLLKQIPAPIP